MRPTLALGGALLLLLATATTAAAQEGPELSVLCVTVSGEPAAGEWDEFSLQDAIATGDAAVEAVAASAACDAPPAGARCMTVAGSGPAEGWTEATLVEAVTAGRAQIVLLIEPAECAQVTRETVDPEDAPDRLPLQVLETGVFGGELSSSYVAIVTNPNPSTWAAQGLPASIQVFDEAGNEIEAVGGFTTLLPGQTGAIVGLLTATEKPVRVEVSFEGADFNWLPTDATPDILEASEVKVKKDPVLGFKTTGNIANSTEQPLEGVLVAAVHRGKGGKIIGSDLTFLTSIPSGGSSPFEIPHLGRLKPKKVASTEIYYQLSTIP